MLQPTRVQAHLSKVPNYLLPPALRTQLVQSKRNAKRAAVGSFKQSVGANKKRKDDPLQSFEYGNGAGGDGGLEGEKDEERDMRLKTRCVCVCVCCILGIVYVCMCVCYIL